MGSCGSRPAPRRPYTTTPYLRTSIWTSQGRWTAKRLSSSSLSAALPNPSSRCGVIYSQYESTKVLHVLQCCSGVRADKHARMVDPAKCYQYSPPDVRHPTSRPLYRSKLEAPHSLELSSRTYTRPQPSLYCCSTTCNKTPHKSKVANAASSIQQAVHSITYNLARNRTQCVNAQILRFTPVNSTVIHTNGGHASRDFCSVCSTSLRV